MWIYKCDRCNKIITKEDKSKAVIAGVEDNRYELCAKCGEPIAKILKRYKLTETK